MNIEFCTQDCRNGFTCRNGKGTLFIPAHTEQGTPFQFHFPDRFSSSFGIVQPAPRIEHNNAAVFQNDLLRVGCLIMIDYLVFGCNDGLDNCFPSTFLLFCKIEQPSYTRDQYDDGGHRNHPPQTAHPRQPIVMVSYAVVDFLPDCISPQTFVRLVVQLSKFLYEYPGFCDVVKFFRILLQEFIPKTFGVTIGC